MISGWTGKQFGRVVDQFRAECPSGAWDDVLIRYAVLLQKGPACGSPIAKKLTAAKGIWELLGHAGNLQPRLLFYFSDRNRWIVFVHAFMKQGKQDYQRAIRLAQHRRAAIERGEKATNEFRSSNPPIVH